MESNVLSFTVASETVSIVSDSYEVQESDEFVNIVVRRIGSMHFTIEGQLTTLAGSATGKICSTFCNFILCRRALSLME